VWEVKLRCGCQLASCEMWRPWYLRTADRLPLWRLATSLTESPCPYALFQARAADQARLAVSESAFSQQLTLIKPLLPPLPGSRRRGGAAECTAVDFYTNCFSLFYVVYQARAAEEARQKAAAAAAATGQQGSGEMDSRMLSALITGAKVAQRVLTAWLAPWVAG